jgi:hypothetical protein
MTNTDTVSDSLNRFNLVTSDHNRGFTMTFSNRVTVSVRWGKYNYSDGKTTAEVAARDADTDEWVHVTGYDYNHDDVLGHLTTNEVAKFVHAAATMPSPMKANS